MDTPLEMYGKRYTKGLYAKARSGQIKGFTGIDQPYEKPENPDLVLKASESTVTECIDQVIKLLVRNNLIPSEVMGEVTELFTSPSILGERLLQATSLPSLQINQIDLQWVQVLSEGWATPLTGFMRESQYLECLYFGQITNDKGAIANQSIPIVLPVFTEDKNRLTNLQAFTLTYNGKAVALLKNPEFYPHRKEERASRIWGTCNPGHPVVKMVLDSGDFLVGEGLEVFERIK